MEQPAETWYRDVAEQLTMMLLHTALQGVLSNADNSVEGLVESLL